MKTCKMNDSFDKLSHQQTFWNNTNLMFLDYPGQCVYENQPYDFGTHDLQGQCSQITCSEDYSLEIERYNNPQNNFINKP